MDGKLSPTPFKRRSGGREGGRAGEREGGSYAVLYLAGWERRIVGDTTLSDTWKSQTAAPPFLANSSTSFGSSARFLTDLPSIPNPRAMAAKSQWPNTDPSSGSPSARSLCTSEP